MELDLERDIGDDDSFDVDDGKTYDSVMDILYTCIYIGICYDLCILIRPFLVEEGPVYAMCMAGQGDETTLAQWISNLQETCPTLGQIPTVFRLESGPVELQTSSDVQQSPEQEFETVHIIEDEPLYSERVKQ